MEINFTLTWWMLCLFLIIASPIAGDIYNSIRPNDWGWDGLAITLVGWIIAIGIAIGQLF